MTRAHVHKLVRGQVMHERLRPAHHRFVAPVFYVRLNLDQLDNANSIWFGVNRARLMSIRTHDYGPRDGSDLAQWMRKLLAEQNIEADGDIILQTFPRLFGLVFNPISLWYCHDAEGSLRAIMAEVNNTFGETHRYLLHSRDHGRITQDTVLQAAKQMHVSPFCEVQGHYQFRFRNTSKSTFVGIDYHDPNGMLIKTTVGGRLQEWTNATLFMALLKQPWLTASVVLGIHWQALRLFLKRVPFFHKPIAPAQSLTVSEEISS